MAYNSEETGGYQVSKYNSGVTQILRLGELWEQANKLSLSGVYDKWNNVLNTIWRELACDLKVGSKNTDEKFKTIAEWKEQLINLKSQFIIGKIKRGDYDAQIRELLEEKEIFIRRLQNELRKGTAVDDEELSPEEFEEDDDS